jgi:hypothetical protein
VTLDGLGLGARLDFFGNLNVLRVVKFMSLRRRPLGQEPFLFMFRIEHVPSALQMEFFCKHTESAQLKFPNLSLRSFRSLLLLASAQMDYIRVLRILTTPIKLYSHAVVATTGSSSHLSSVRKCRFKAWKVTAFNA